MLAHLQLQHTAAHTGTPGSQSIRIRPREHGVRIKGTQQYCQNIALIGRNMTVWFITRLLCEQPIPLSNVCSVDTSRTINSRNSSFQQNYQFKKSWISSTFLLQFYTQYNLSLFCRFSKNDFVKFSKYNNKCSTSMDLYV